MIQKQRKIAKYEPHSIEEKWRKIWEKEAIYTFAQDSKKAKYYCLVELPYPSGDLHIGHWFSFATADVHARVHKMMGKNVFFTNGFDAFGLPAENAAIKRGIHPKDWTMSNIATMKKQFEQMGTMIDWSHETITCLPEYYTWNQWIFIEMYKKGLAYRGKAFGNWCPKDMTVLANEHVENGKCWRCGTEVIQKEAAQWFLKLTEYADRLLWEEDGASSVKRQASNNQKDEEVDWPGSVKIAQNQWIGRKEGVKIIYHILPIAHTANTAQQCVEVFTTRPETNFGATYIAIAPEHPLIQDMLQGTIQIPDTIRKEIKDYVAKAHKKTQLERQIEGKEKTGVFTGLYAINQLTNYKMPIWISDFVLIGFGTGALVGVPGHDKRDFEFARKYNLDIKRVVVGTDGDTSPITKSDHIQEGAGTMMNSDFLNGMDIYEAKKKMTEYLVEKGWAKEEKIYHIHDWSISRQRYWGTPVPMIHCPTCGIVPVSEKNLPVLLPYDVDFAPKGKPPLATATEWLSVKCPQCYGKARRDAETLDTFFDSSWYFFRYIDPGYKDGPFPKNVAKKLLPVDIYFGGSEHTLGHTLYARFFTRFFQDLGLVDFSEFAHKRVQHGVILGTDGNRMSKSKGNVVNPDAVVKEYGADAVRLYLCFMMPYEATAPWNPGGMWGVYRFLKRVWDLPLKVASAEVKSKSITDEDLFEMHTAIKKVGEDAGSTKFNTGVSTLMKWLNYLEGKSTVHLEEYKTFLLLLAPFAPHITEELWQRLELDAEHLTQDDFKSIHQHSWPIFDKKYLVEATALIVIQINGKMRDSIEVESREVNMQQVIEEKAKQREKISTYLEGKNMSKIIYIPGKILNFVVR